ncbi:MAG: sigma-70 family RNA polymerase sigma factor [Chitinophagaceae bacterium]
MYQKLFYNKMNDIEVLEKVLAGEDSLYEIIIRRYNPLLYKVGRSYGLQHEDVQDAMQETFIAGYEKLSQFQKRSQLSTWLTRIMINKCLYKMKKKIDNIPLNTSGDYIAHADEIIGSVNDKFPLQNELKKILELSLEKLPEHYRLVFLLRETENFSVAQTAETLGLTQINVKVRLTRAKAMLRDYIEEWYSKTDIYDFNLKYCSEVVENVFLRISQAPIP